VSPLRILIIDDDRRRRPTDDPSLPREERLPSTGASALGDGERASGSVVRELTMPTPIPGTIPRFDLLDAGTQPVTADAGFLRELVARVQELLLRTRGDRHDAEPAWPVPHLTPLALGELTLDLPAQAVLKRGRPVKVTQTEFRLLIALMRRRGAVASRQDLLQDVWGSEAVISPRVVDTHVARLRRKVEDDPRRPRHIVTALTSGYRFVA
jgi:two-component system KDP operon response regulator KdpE